MRNDLLHESHAVKSSLAARVETLEPRRLLAVVLQADFTGTGTGTGVGHLVSLGATGSLISNAGSSVTSSQVATAPFVSPDSGGCLRLVDAGLGIATSAGVHLKPLSSANSPDSWYTDGGTSTFDTVNGAFDFYFRSSIASTSWDGSGVAFRPLDISGGNGGLRMIINSTTPNNLQMELKAVNAGGAIVMDLFTVKNGVNFAANTVYHMAGTVSTDAAGKVSIKLFAARGNVDIDTNSNAYLIASANSASAMDTAASNAINHAFNSATAAGFDFGKMRNTDALAQTQEFDDFRIYNSVPATFDSLVYYPDAVGYTQPGDNPALPAAFDPFTPPVNDAIPSTNTPTIAEYTRTAGPGDSLVLTGDLLTTHSGADLAKDTAFLTYGQSANSLNIDSSTIPAIETDKATITLDNALPAGSAYFLWPRNSNGYGRPVIVNKAEAWWVGPDQATRGQTISLYGKNLSYHGGTTTAWIYIKPASGAGQWATVSAANPYKVDFLVPASLANGTYQIWAHNGSGGKYGWSGPVTLTVNNGASWTGSTLNVTSAPYNAKGDGVTNNYNAIQSAINTAHNLNNFSTVYIPAGTYLINSKLQLYSNIRLDGDGAASTILKGGSVGFGAATSRAPTQLREWETATLANGPAIYNSADAFAGQAVGPLSQTDASVTLANINGGTGGGLADLTFRYANGGAKAIKSLYVNGVFNRNIEFAGTGGDDKYSDVVATDVNLAAGGGNSIRLVHDAADTGSINLDRLVVGTYGQGLLTLGLSSSVTNVTVQELTVDVSSSGDNFALYGKASNLVVENANLTQLGIGNYGSSATYIYDSDHLFFRGVDVISQLITLRTRQVFVDGSDFYGRNDKHLFNNQSGMSEFAATNNTGRDYDNTVLDGWGSGVWWKFLNGGATAQRGFYFQNNTSYDLGIRPGVPDQNWGEQYSWEQDFSHFIAGPTHNSIATASVSSATANSVTFSTTVPQPAAGMKYFATIIDGKGVGQWRTITAYSGSSITLDEPWTVIPDGNSTISVLAGAQQIAIYGNTMDGKYQDVTDSAWNNSAGIQPYGGVFNLVADGNTIHETRQGIGNFGIGERNPASLAEGTDPVWFFEPNYFHLYANNTLQYNRYAMYQNIAGADYAAAIPAMYISGVVYRGNVVENAYESGFALYAIDPGTAPRWQNMNVIERGSFTNVSIGVDLTQGYSRQLGNLTFLNNTFDRGTATYAGSKGLWMEFATQQVNLQNNQWLNFQAPYAGTLRGAALAAPLPVMELRVPQGGAALTRLMPVWNEGAASLIWSGSADAPWLTIAGDGNLNTGTSANASLTITPTTLLVGVYDSIITFAAGSQTRKATVRLVVIPHPPSTVNFQINDGSIQRSKINSLIVTFDRPVMLASDAFTLLRRGGTVFVPDIAPASGYATTFTLTFSGLGIIGGSLPDGAYTLTIKAPSAVDAFSQSLIGTNRTYKFHRLFGDVNGDRIVNNTDLAVFKSALNSAANYLWYLNYDGLGSIINKADYLQFRSRLVKPLL